MDFDSISRFVAVVETGSFAAAARRQDITPQALSTSIAKLEVSLGVSLFDRERGGITRTTEFGDTFLPHAQFLLAAGTRAMEELHARRDAKSGWVRLGVAESVAGSVISKAIKALRAEAPDASVAVVEGYTQDLLERMDRGEIDLIAGAPDSERSQRRNLAQSFLYAANDVLVVRREHPLAGKAGVTLEDMQGFTWMLPYARHDSYQVMVETYAKHGLKMPANVLYSDSATVGIELLATEDYILFVSPEIFWPRLGKDDAPFGALYTNEPTIERQACLTHRSDYPLSPMADRLRVLIEEQVALRNASLAAARENPRAKPSGRARTRSAPRRRADPAC